MLKRIRNLSNRFSEDAIVFGKISGINLYKLWNVQNHK